MAAVEHLMRTIGPCIRVELARKPWGLVPAQAIVLQYLRGGQLLDHLHTIGDQYSEQQAAELFAQARPDGGV